MSDEQNTTSRSFSAPPVTLHLTDSERSQAADLLDRFAEHDLDYALAHFRDREEAAAAVADLAASLRAGRSEFNAADVQYMMGAYEVVGLGAGGTMPDSILRAYNAQTWTIDLSDQERAAVVARLRAEHFPADAYHPSSDELAQKVEDGAIEFARSEAGAVWSRMPEFESSQESPDDTYVPELDLNRAMAMTPVEALALDVAGSDDESNKRRLQRAYEIREQHTRWVDALEQAADAQQRFDEPPIYPDVFGLADLIDAKGDVAAAIDSNAFVYTVAEMFGNGSAWDNGPLGTPDLDYAREIANQWRDKLVDQGVIRDRIIADALGRPDVFLTGIAAFEKGWESPSTETDTRDFEVWEPVFSTGGSAISLGRAGVEDSSALVEVRVLASGEMRLSANGRALTSVGEAAEVLGVPESDAAPAIAVAQRSLTDANKVIPAARKAASRWDEARWDEPPGFDELLEHEGPATEDGPVDVAVLAATVARLSDSVGELTQKVGALEARLADKEAQLNQTRSTLVNVANKLRASMQDRPTRLEQDPGIHTRPAVSAARAPRTPDL